MNEHNARKNRTRLAITLASLLALALTGCALAGAAGDSVSGIGGGPAPTSASDLGNDDGYIADGDNVSAFADDLPAIANLDPDLRAALQNAAGDAVEDGVEMFVTDGWRSERYQRFLFDQAVTNYLSEAEARKWVKTPDDSTHVSGFAVDIGPTDANSWLSQHGSDYGLCQTYGNEMWHFELAVRPGETCPAPLNDASAE